MEQKITFLLTNCMLFQHFNGRKRKTPEFNHCFTIFIKALIKNSVEATTPKTRYVPWLKSQKRLIGRFQKNTISHNWLKTNKLERSIFLTTFQHSSLQFLSKKVQVEYFFHQGSKALTSQGYNQRNQPKNSLDRPIHHMNTPFPIPFSHSLPYKRIHKYYDVQYESSNQHSIQQKIMSTQSIKTIMKSHVPAIRDKQITIEKLSGLTNVTYAVYVNEQPLFIFKTFSDGFDRELENKIVKSLSEKMLSPRVIFASDAIRIEEFLINTTHPTNQDFNDLTFVQRIMDHLYTFHQVKIESKEETLSDFLFSPHQKMELQSYNTIKAQNIKGNFHLYGVLFDRIWAVLGESEQLGRKLLPKTRQSIRLCHNDLNNLNILFASEKMHFIDYDYVGKNYLAYDIANFISETAIDYSEQPYPGVRLIKVYTYEEITKIAKMYPGYYAGLELETLKFISVASLYWAIWSIKRFAINKSQGFGVAEHGMMRMDLFEKYMQLLKEVEENNNI